MGKVVTKEEYKKIKSQLAEKKVVLCHGVFDLVHPGHIVHFQEAKALGDILVVSVTAEKYVRKGPGRPYFDDEMRLSFLAAIACIDYVILSEGYTVDDIICSVEPDLYVKGQEYAKAEDDITGKIEDEIALVREHGGDVHYTTGQVFSSTKLINHALPAMTEEVKTYMKEFKKLYSMEDIKGYVEQMKNQKVLVIGDVIIDEYVYCSVQGLMSKNTAYSARFHKKEQYLGGAIAVARHISSFTSHVKVLSITGQETEYTQLFEERMKDRLPYQFIQSPEYPTIVKQRFVSENEKRDEVDKIFVINNIPMQMVMDENTMDSFYQAIEKEIKQYDMVVLCDFGHGLVDNKVISILEKQAPFLSVNCQTNSSNMGMNLITKYQKADVFALDERELKMALPDYHYNEEDALRKLGAHLHCGGWLTRGSKGAVNVSEGATITHCPALTLKVTDTIGAGDAFYSVAALCAAVHAPWEIGSFLGNIAGALGTNIVGNKEAIDKINVLKYASTLMNV